MNANFISQYVNKATRQNNLLDLVLTNDINLVKQVKVEDTKLSDHRMIIINSYFGLNPKTAPKAAFIPHTFRNLNLYKADFGEINNNLKSIKWDDLRSICSLEDFPELVRLTVLQICELHAPTKCHRSTRLSSYKRERRTLSRKKRKQLNRLDNDKLNSDEKLQIKIKLVKFMKKYSLALKVNPQKVKRKLLKKSEMIHVTFSAGPKEN